MPETVTPKELARELGISDRTIRRWIRDQGWQSVPYARLATSDEQAAKVRAHFKG